jgi:hypothetical protein
MCCLLHSVGVWGLCDAGGRSSAVLLGGRRRRRRRGRRRNGDKSLTVSYLLARTWQLSTLLAASRGQLFQ